MNAQPNILLITAHDLGTHLGCYGWDPAIRTPRLDELAEQGVRFENHFCTAPYCSPSRGAMLTGRYPHVNGLMGLVNLGWDIPDDNPYLPTVLSRAGYNTELFGLQHVAADPGRLGYHRINQSAGHGCRNVSPMVVEAIDMAEKDRPFYFEVGFSEVHRAFGDLEHLTTKESDVRPPPFLDDTPGLRMDLVAFYEHLHRLDVSVGTILDALDRNSLRENTLVVFVSDHGIAFPRSKATLYDAGIRTALLMRWPGGFDGNRLLSSARSNVDLFATLAEVGGATLDHRIDGQSFLAALHGETDHGRTHIFAEKNTTIGDAKRCIRTERYKLIRNFDEGPCLALPTDIEVTASRRDMGDAHLEPRPAVEFYDLDADPLELHNLSGTESFREVEAEMTRELQQVMEETADPILKGPVPRPPGEAAQTESLRSAEGMQRRQNREALLWQEFEELKNLS
jgi:N-sulfoglucosamine sulfohydrolase